MSLRVALVDARARAQAKVRAPHLCTTVAPDDDMRHPPDGSLRVYFQIGASALEQIRAGLVAAGAAEPRRILDLPSGYGRVLRYLRATWPRATIAAMELNADAAAFCAATFGAEPIVSRDPVWSVASVATDYDLVFSGSLLTHFAADAWPRALAYLRDRLAGTGVLVLTTHGRRPLQLLQRDPTALAEVRREVAGWDGDYGVGDLGPALAASAEATGFAFTRYPWQPESPYGVSFSTPEWVREAVAGVGGLRVVRHVPAGWFHHQDVWTLVRA